MDGMDAPVYSLLVCVGNETHKLFGNREDLESVLDRWVAGELVTKVKVIGFCNTADRARRVFAFDPEAVIVMSLAMEF